ncbi:MAG: hypothetical protein ACLGIA_13255, partial [Actinomycetes bacterium]
MSAATTTCTLGQPGQILGAGHQVGVQVVDLPGQHRGQQVRAQLGAGAVLPGAVRADPDPAGVPGRGVHRLPRRRRGQGGQVGHQPPAP